jgi:hypothetical protein
MMRLGASGERGILSPTGLPIPPSRLALILTDVPISTVSSKPADASNHQMTKLGSSLLSAVLLSALVTLPTTRPDASLMIAMQAPPAGCHQHGPAPVSQPVSYRCCQSGHDSALLPISFAAQLDSGDLTDGHPIRIPVPSFHDRGHSRHNLATSSSDPPNTTPLRV